MNPAFLAPFFLAGLALALLPWLIHRIRRQEHKPIPFSSLIFVPPVDKQLIERRRLQHLLLMLLRIAALALLALAFSRPFLPSGSLLPELRGTPTAHVLLVDTSLSMNAGGRMEQARNRAREILKAIPQNEPVALIGFAASASVIRPFAGAQDDVASHRRDVDREIESLDAGMERTDLLAALLAAESRIRDLQGKDGRGLIHLVSDLQASGFAGSPSTAWRLPPETELRVYDAGGADTLNRSVTDVALRRTAERTFRIAARIRNWSMPPEDRFSVKLYVGGELREERPMSVLRHHASQVAFAFAPATDGPFDGWIEIADDELAGDNRRFFAWRPPVPPRVVVLEAGAGGEGWPSGWFARSALEGVAGSAFEVSTLQRDQAVGLLTGAGERPDVIVWGELDGTERELIDPLLAWVRNGGRALLTLNPTAVAAQLNGGLLSHVGLGSAGPLGAEGSRPSHALFGWIDYAHPVFREFGAPRYNDFSSVRVFAYQHLTEPRSRGVTDAVRVVARLEASRTGEPGPPALVEVALGEGKLLIWSFAFDPAVTNFPKSSRFAPVIFESLKHLGGEVEGLADLEIGAAAPVQSGTTAIVVRDAAGEAQRIPLNVGEHLPVAVARPGVLWAERSASEPPVILGVGNTFAAESEPVRLTPESVRARVASPAGSTPAPMAGMAGAHPAPSRTEFGLVVLATVLALLLVEVWYAPRLVR